MKGFGIMKGLWSLFVAFLMFISTAFGPTPKSTDTAVFISEQRFVGDGLLYAGQGISTDGEYFYAGNTISPKTLTTSIAKYTFDGKEMKIVNKKLYPLTNEALSEGYNHIGGVSVYNGKLYASVEGGKKINACIAVFNTSDLSPTGELYRLDYEHFEKGIPWLAVDGDTGYLYATRWTETDEMYVFDTDNNMELVKIIKLSSPVKRIQGGEFYKGLLYVSSDTAPEDNKTCKRILKIDVHTGSVSEFALRDLGIETTEAEGMTICETPDGSNLHVLDWNKKTLTVYVRHYKVNF